MINTQPELSLVREAHLVERNSICGLRVSLDVDGEHFVLIMLGSDGRIKRMGIGSVDGAERDILSGTSTPSLFQQVRQKVTPELLQWRGQSWSDPAPRGKTCELTISFMHADGRETRMYWWYGSESQEPPPEVREFVLAAVEATKPWYEQRMEMDRRKRQRVDDSWGQFFSAGSS